MYNAAQQQGGAAQDPNAGAGNSGSNNDNVQDADFEEVK
jgi:hypothetical protein